MHLKEGLISEVILTLVTLPKKKVKFEFPALYSKQLIQTSYSGSEIWHLFAKMPSEIKFSDLFVILWSPEQL